MCYKFTHVTCKNAGKDIVSRRVSDAFYLLQGLFVLKIWDFKHALVCHGSRSLDSVADRSIY